MRFGLQLNARHLMPEDIRHRLEELPEHVRRAQPVGFHPTVAPDFACQRCFGCYHPGRFWPIWQRELIACVWSRASCCAPYRFLRLWQNMWGHSMPSATAGVDEE